MKQETMQRVQKSLTTARNAITLLSSQTAPDWAQTSVKDYLKAAEVTLGQNRLDVCQEKLIVTKDSLSHFTEDTRSCPAYPDLFRHISIALEEFGLESLDEATYGPIESKEENKEEGESEEEDEPLPEETQPKTPRELIVPEEVAALKWKHRVSDISIARELGEGIDKALVRSVRQSQEYPYACITIALEDQQKLNSFVENIRENDYDGPEKTRKQFGLIDTETGRASLARFTFGLLDNA